VPILSNHGQLGVLLLASSISELINNFHELSNTDIGIFSIISPLQAEKTSQFSFNTKNQTRLKPWNSRLHAFSNLKDKQQLIYDITHNISLQQLSKHPQQLKIKTQWLEVQTVALQTEDEQAPTSWILLVTDISKIKQTLEQQNKTMIITALLSVIVTSLLLFIMLWPPFRKLSKISAILPLFSQNKFQQIRTELNDHKNPSLLINEISQLGHSAISLSYQLENLHQEIDKKTQEIVLQSHELMRERDFVTSLINTSDALILTQDINGCILMINKKGRSLLEIDDNYLSLDTCLQNNPLKNHKLKSTTLYFEQMMPDSDMTTEIKTQLIDVRYGKSHRFQHEARILHQDNSIHTISWYHSTLSAQGEDGSVIMSIGIDITERKVVEQQLAWIADHDPLTKLFNRRRFQYEMEQTLERIKKTNEQGALLYFDVDHFKFVNDSQGHQAGDRLLQLIADNLKINMKQQDIIARLGGDEFCIILHNINQKTACNIARRVNETIAGIHNASLGGTYKISVSIGIVMFPDDGLCIADLLANADLAMYQSKERQRGSYTLFSNNKQSRQKVIQLMSRKQRIEQALEQENFVLYYQPIYSIKEKKITHYESLLRMIDNNGDILLPGNFIPEAEQLGLIQEIDKLVIKKAIQSLHKIQQQKKTIKLSINLSGKAIDDESIIHNIEQQISQYHIDSHQIIFELTETAAVSDINKATNLMGKLKELGCQFALDDFGVGFSSFIYLKQLPVDYVKIDGLFIKNIHTNKADKLFVKALNEVAHGLGKKTIAEFVENQQIIDILTDLGVDYAQGYHIGKPAKNFLNITD
jgi:diguanylate cyclase (GGDEF)-like protein